MKFLKQLIKLNEISMASQARSDERRHFNTKTPIPTIGDQVFIPKQGFYKITNIDNKYISIKQFKNNETTSFKIDKTRLKSNPSESDGKIVWMYR